MIWTECPRCQGESGDWCGGQCHDGGLYICEHCGNAEEENSEECPCCGKVDEDMRLARLKTEAEDGSEDAAAELYALESGDHDKAALRAAFLAGVRWVGEPAANADLLAALKMARVAIGEHYAPHDCYVTGPLTGNHYLDLVACPACAFMKLHDAAIAKAEGGAS